MKKKMIMGILILLVLLVVFALRVQYVNVTAKLPEIREIPQGQTVDYEGISYTVVGAELWRYEQFFAEHDGLDDYNDSNFEDDTACVLLVRYQIEKKKEESLLHVDMPIRYAYQYNGIDPFMLQDMNPSLMNGTFASGDILTIPYEVYRINLREKTWRQICNLDMPYSVILGTYPVKTEIKITDIEKKGAW